jgi:hypothetical protein
MSGILDGYVERIVTYEKEKQRAEHTIEKLTDTIAALEKVIYDGNLAAPVFGRRKTDSQTQPLKRKE